MPRSMTTIDRGSFAAPMSVSNQSGALILRTDLKFNGVKVFSATMVADRDQLGEKVTDWMAKHSQTKKVTDLVITQSSDEAFHCIAITVFYWEDTRR
jgi:hypothetical protein